MLVPGNLDNALAILAMGLDVGAEPLSTLTHFRTTLKLQSEQSGTQKYFNSTSPLPTDAPDQAPLTINLSSAAPASREPAMPADRPFHQSIPFAPTGSLASMNALSESSCDLSSSMPSTTTAVAKLTTPTETSTLPHTTAQSSAESSVGALKARPIGRRLPRLLGLGKLLLVELLLLQR